MPLNHLIYGEQLWHKSQQVLLGSITQNNSKQRKRKTEAPHLPEKLFCTERATGRKEKTTLREWENVCNEVKERNSSPNMQTAHATQDQKNSQPSRKTGQDLNGHLSKEGIRWPKRTGKRCWASLLKECWSNPRRHRPAHGQSGLCQKSTSSKSWGGVGRRAPPTLMLAMSV